MYHVLKGKVVDAKMWIPPHEVESSALDQIRNVCSLPHVHGVSIMPDVHTGAGATIGSVIYTKDTIAPSLVGVDIGCGMEAVKTSLNVDKLREKVLRKIHDGIKERIPVGFNAHESVHKSVKDNDLWNDLGDLAPGAAEVFELAKKQLGTLGGGNHFIELSIDEDMNVWIMLHSGSRRIGKTLADIHIAAAMNLDHNKTGLPDKALAYFVKDTPEFDQYYHDLMWAQAYAKENRKRMLDLITGYLEHLYPSVEFSEHVSCHHNYVSHITDGTADFGYITRKGAIKAHEGQLGIIPGAMGVQSYIVKGKGNMDSFCSAPHGAGRKMSRSKAKKKYRLQDAEETMKGIVCDIDKHTVDEIRYAYKDIESVMQYSEDLVEPVYRLEQLINIKG